MKSYNHLWEGFLSEDNIITAIGNSSKGKRDRKKIKKIYKHPEDYVEYYRDYGLISIIINILLLRSMTESPGRNVRSLFLNTMNR